MITEMVVRNARPRDSSYKIADAQSLYLFVTRSGYQLWWCISHNAKRRGSWLSWRA